MFEEVNCFHKNKVKRKKRKRRKIIKNKNGRTDKKRNILVNKFARGTNF